MITSHDTQLCIKAGHPVKLIIETSLTRRRDQRQLSCTQSLHYLRGLSGDWWVWWYSGLVPRAPRLHPPPSTLSHHVLQSSPWRLPVMPLFITFQYLSALVSRLHTVCHGLIYLHPQILLSQDVYSKLVLSGGIQNRAI